MKVVLDCNIWVQAAEKFGRLPNSASELAKTDIGKILNLALRGRKVNGEELHLVVSRHIILTTDHVLARKGMCESGEFRKWALDVIVGRLRAVDAVTLDTTEEDYPGLAARAGHCDGAENAEDEAVLRTTIDNSAILVTDDTMLASVAGRRTIGVYGGRAFTRLCVR